MITLKRIILLLLIISNVFILISCSGLQKKIDAAEAAIRESEKVNAAKYAPKVLGNAKDRLQTAKDQQQLKKNKDAEKNADRAKYLGDDAYSKSLTRFVKDQNETTRMKMNDAKAVHADKLFPEKFNKAKTLYDDVQIDFKKVNALSKKLKQLEK